MLKISTTYSNLSVKHIVTIYDTDFESLFSFMKMPTFEELKLIRF